MKLIKILAVMALGLSTAAMAQDWNSSPQNFENSPSNFENSPSNFKNSPNNFENSPNNYGNPNIIRDNNGNASGYAVPKANGGVNFYAPDGTRRGYLPPAN